MKDSKIEWVGEIPETWENYKLKNLIAIHFSGNWGADPMGDENDLLCIRIADFDFGNQTIKMSANTLRHYTYSQANRLLLQDGDLLLEKSGGGDKNPVGRVVMFEKCRYNGSTVFANFSECLRVNEKNVSRYIAYYLKALYYNCNMRDFFTQTTGLQNLNLFKYLNIKIAMSNKYEQQRIADFLDRECERIDGLKADIEAQIETLEKYKRSVITEAVTHGLNLNVPMKDSGLAWIGDIPLDWDVGRIGGLYELRNEKVSDKDYMPLSVTMKGILPQLETAAKTNDGDNRKLVRKGDFAINSRSDRRGSCGISDYDGSVSLINTILKPRNQMEARYYNWLFHTPNFSDEFYKWGHGIVDDLWTTTWQEMKRIQIPVPPLSEQQAIADYLDEKCAQIDELVSQKQSQIETLETYKKSLIFEYVTGKKEVV